MGKIGLVPFLTLLLVICSSNGCRPVPRVHYRPVSVEDITGQIKFVLPRSLILLSVRRSVDEGQQLVAIAVPSDLPSKNDPRLYAITPANNLGVRTHFNVTYIPNTRIISSLGTQIEDNRAKTIAEITGIITGVKGLGFQERIGPEETPPVLPIVIDPDAYLSARMSGRIWMELPKNSDWVYRLDVEPIPPDAVPTGKFFATNQHSVKVLPVSACRDAVLYLHQGTISDPDSNFNAKLESAWTFGLKIADPGYVQTVQLPTQGKIDMHPACGFNLTDAKTDSASTWSVIGELVKQTSAIKKTYEQTPSGTKKR